MVWAKSTSRSIDSGLSEQVLVHEKQGCQMVAGHRHDFRQSMKHTIVLLIALMPSPFRQDPAIKIPVWRTLKENRSEAPSSFKCRQVAASPEQLWRRYVTRNRMWVRYAMNIVFQFRQFFFDLFVAAGVEVPHTITCRRKIGSGAAAPLLLPILYVKRVFLFPGLALQRHAPQKTPGQTASQQSLS